MREYHKIQSVFKRDPENHHKTFLMGDWSLPEFGYLAMNDWTFTEKVDGTNIRVIVEAGFCRFGGKTDAASIPTPLTNRLHDRFVPQAELLHSMFPEGACLYGEGYGARIQKGGGNYRPDQDFVLFDVSIGGFWLQRKDVEDITAKLSLDIVPIIGTGTLHDAIDMAMSGFKSKWGDFPAEGIIARPATELHTRTGARVITKVKLRDFMVPQP